MVQQGWTEISQSIVAVLEAALGKGATLGQALVLLHIAKDHDAGEISEMRSLAKSLGLDRRTVSRYVSLMGDHGALHRRGLGLLHLEPAQDRRSKIVGLTNQGLLVARQLRSEIAGHSALSSAIAPQIQQMGECDTGVVTTDRNGFINWANQPFIDMTGYPLYELLHKRPGSLLRGALTEASPTQSMRIAVRTGEESTVQITNYAKSGQAYRVNIHLLPIHVGGELTGFVAFETKLEDLAI